MSYYVMSGLGVGEGAVGYECVTVPYTTNKGVEGSGQLCDQAGVCGNAYSLQQALNALGFGPIDVDGDVGPKTKSALDKAASTYGVPRTPGTAPDQDLCEAIGSAWSKNYYGPSTTTKLPLVASRATDPRAMSISRLPSALRFPSGVLRSGTLPEGQSEGVGAKVSNWWANLETPGKVAVVGGAVVALGLLAYALSKPGRSVELEVPMKANASRSRHRKLGRKSRKWKSRYFLASGKEITSEEYRDALDGGHYVYRRGPSGWSAHHLSPIAWRLGSGPSHRKVALARHDVPKAVLKSFEGYTNNRSMSFTLRANRPFVSNPAPALRVKIGGKSWGHGTAPKKYRKLGFTKPQHYAWPYGYMYPIGNAKHVRLAAGRFGKHAKRYPPLVRQLIAARLDNAKKYFGIGPYRGRVTPHKGKHAFAIRGGQKIAQRVQRRRGRKAA